MVRSHVVRRFKPPAGLDSRRAAMFGGQQQCQGTAYSDTAARFGREVQPPHPNHQGGRGQIGNHHRGMSVTQRFFYRPKQKVAFGRRDKKDMTGIDLLCDCIRAKNIGFGLTPNPDHGPPRLCRNRQGQGIPSLSAEFVYPAKAQGNVRVSENEFRGRTVRAPGQQGRGSSHGESINVRILFSRDSSHFARRLLPPGRAIGLVSEKFVLRTGTCLR